MAIDQEILRRIMWSGLWWADDGSGSSGPTPSTGSFVDLSWFGDTSVFDFDVPFGTANTYNTLVRNSTATSFVDRTIESTQTVAQGTAFVFSGDLDTDNNTGIWFSIGQTGIHHSGITFSDLEFALRADRTGATINWEWWESGTNTGTVATTTNGDVTAWAIEYDGSNGITVYVDGTQVTTATSTYTTEDMAMYILGRDQNGTPVSHIALKTVAQPNRILLPLGDSITFGRAVSGVAGGSYVYKTIAFENHRHFVNPVLAENGATSALVNSVQVPQASKYYDATYDSNIALLMVGRNDLAAAVPALTIISNLTTVISALQGQGWEVLITTIIRDHSVADYADRSTVNDWIIDTSGADYKLDLRGTTLETDTGLFEVDLIHPNPSGMTVIADNLWLVTKDI